MKGAQDALALRESQTPLVGGQNPHLHKNLQDIQTPLIGQKRKAAEVSRKGEFEAPIAPSKRVKKSEVNVPETPLRDQMRLNMDPAHYSEAWEKSSIASRYSSASGLVPRVDIKASLGAIPAPKQATSDSIADEQIARLEADIAMREQDEKTQADV